MIKVVSAYSGPGGSTVALAALCNLFNSNGLRCEYYGVSEWVRARLNRDCFRPHKALALKKDDFVIWHMIRPPNPRPQVRKFVLSCHETNLYPVAEVKDGFDAIHFVSRFQQEWHGVDGVVIPNIIEKFTKRDKRTTHKVAGIVGSIDKHKRVHLSLERALTNPEVDRVEIWGLITDFAYFQDQVVPSLGSRTSYHGLSKNMQEVYDRLDVVYASSQRECLPMIQGECLQAGVEYQGLPESTRDASDYIFDDQLVLEKWKRLLGLGRAATATETR
jgi:hypothetical protein